jgi:hypothetical protein
MLCALNFVCIIWLLRSNLKLFILTLSYTCVQFHFQIVCTGGPIWRKSPSVIILRDIVLNGLSFTLHLSTGSEIIPQTASLCGGLHRQAHQKVISAQVCLLVTCQCLGTKFNQVSGDECNRPCKLPESRTYTVCEEGLHERQRPLLYLPVVLSVLIKMQLRKDDTIYWTSIVFLLKVTVLN